jgi:transcriptional regulator with XRE-family HTH domain
MDEAKIKAAMFSAAVGENILIHRETGGISRQKMAQQVGVSVQFVRRVEHGKANVRLLTLNKIAAVLGVSVADLVDVAGSEMGLATTDRSGC